MMNPVDEDVVPAEVEVRKNSDKPAADLDNIVLRKNRCKDGKKEQRRYLTTQNILRFDNQTNFNLCIFNALKCSLTAL